MQVVCWPTARTCQRPFLKDLNHDLQKELCAPFNDLNKDTQEERFIPLKDHNKDLQEERFIPFKGQR